MTFFSVFTPDFMTHIVHLPLDEETVLFLESKTLRAFSILRLSKGTICYEAGLQDLLVHDTAFAFLECPWNLVPASGPFDHVFWGHFTNQ